MLIMHFFEPLREPCLADWRNRDRGSTVGSSLRRYGPAENGADREDGSVAEDGAGK